MADSQSHSNGLTAPAFGAVLDASPDALLAVAPDGTITMANAAAERLFGFSRNELAGRKHHSLFTAGFRAEVERLIHQLLTAPGEHPPPREVSGLNSMGTEFSAEVAASLLHSPSPDGESTGGGAPQLLLSVRGTSHRTAAQEDLREAMSLLTATLESTADGILVMSNEGQVAGFNDQFLTMWGIPPELLEGDSEEPVIRLVVSQVADPVAFMGRVTELEDNPAAESHDVLDFKDGRTFERYSRPQRVGNKIVGRVWSFRDVTPRRKAQEQAHQAMLDLAAQAEKLRAMAFQDPLTGLANRAVFNDGLAEALKEPRLKAVDVLLLDLDDFKEVNDILGHQAGDDMLIEVARRLRGCVPTADVVARLGGDEFVVLLTACPNADEIAACIVRCLHVPVTIDGTVHAAAQPQPGPRVPRGGQRGRLRAAAARGHRHVRSQGRRKEPLPPVPPGHDDGPGAAHRHGERDCNWRCPGARSRWTSSRSCRTGWARWRSSRRWHGGTGTASACRRRSLSPWRNARD
jgi:PAS domain S-box-containing protein